MSVMAENDGNRHLSVMAENNVIAQNCVQRTKMTISGNLLQMVAMFEGFRSKSYQDVGGIWTIGYGSTLWDNMAVGPDMTVTEEDARIQLTYRLDALRSRINTRLQGSHKMLAPAHQLDALTSLADNIGTGALYESELFRLYRLGSRDSKIALEWYKWRHVNGVSVEGLEKRRIMESFLFMYGWDYAIAKRLRWPGEKGKVA